jgi:hypothetical protein
MQLNIPTPYARLPNPGLPPEGFPPMKERFENYLPGYREAVISNIVYKLPGLGKGKMILPGNINSKIEDYKPTTLERIIFH